MRPYLDILAYFAGFLLLSSLDAVLYYTVGRHHSKLPFVLAGVVTLAVGVIAALALYQTYRHRDDEEPW